jgi:hypothetical protein
MRRVQKKMRKKAPNQYLGRSCGRFSAKIHATCDALDNPKEIAAFHQSGYTKIMCHPIAFANGTFSAQRVPQRASKQAKIRERLQRNIRLKRISALKCLFFFRSTNKDDSPRNCLYQLWLSCHHLTSPHKDQRDHIAFVERKK